MEFIFEIIFDFVSDVLFEGSYAYAKTSKKGAIVVRTMIFSFLIGMSGLFLYMGYMMRDKTTMMFVFYCVSGLFVALKLRLLVEIKRKKLEKGKREEI
ncbi:hypothetical protein HMI01_27180 [Halolactibacillus miurensis]|uniref:Uncharacterized protein n=1 Tax=Halolactibacillus miurensis TaxID=306541 RepID=A0A1I6UZR6_9BACI|nr:hypothetical protein [Halolactibacillus miurensis]GEM05730.1 hypothetical protein HMI01_27180 [Halolactibacillus miurensis]SFT06945.1 hypothetical protein SAMN05421668_1386 [Halolactibacillus miurensis]